MHAGLGLLSQPGQGLLQGGGQRGAVLARQIPAGQLEGQVDGLHDSGMKGAFLLQKVTPDPLAFMVSREIYKHMERIADAFEDVANEIDSLVIDHA